MIKGIIFDFDGTLMNSNAIHTDSFVEMFKEYGIDVDRDKLIENFGIPAHDIIKNISGFDGEKLEEAIQKKRKIAEDLMNDKKFPEISEITIKKLKKMGFKLSIVTGAYSTFVRSVMSSELIDIIYGADSGLSPKPAPDMLYKAAESMGLDIKECIFIGDSHIDLEAARAADINFIAIKSELSWPDMKDANPKIIINKIEEILDIIDEYPKEL